MKKLSLLAMFVAITVAFSACKKDEETSPGSGDGNSGPTYSQEQNAVAFYLSGNWCGPCGLYGKPAMKAVTDKYGDKLVVVACHLNGGIADPLNISAANSIAGAWGVTGVPTCAIGGAGMSGTRVGGGSQMQSTIETRFDAITANTASTSTLIDAKEQNGQITIKTNTKFFDATSDEHFISVYVTEDNIAGRQFISGQGWDDNAVHNHVLRRQITTNATGDAFTTTATAGQEISKDFSTSMEPQWNKANLKAVVVVWKNGSNGRVLVNGTAVTIK